QYDNDKTTVAADQATVDSDKAQVEQARVNLDTPRSARRSTRAPGAVRSMSAILGTMPIALAIGSGAELRQPLGVAVVGGLIVSPALTLYTVPVPYIYMDRFGDWIGSFARSKKTAQRDARRGTQQPAHVRGEPERR
ncbi:MAG: efflux RND transporter permease subunit, partial [Stellaceae bacterium]